MTTPTPEAWEAEAADIAIKAWVLKNYGGFSAFIHKRIKKLLLSERQRIAASVEELKDQDAEALGWDIYFEAEGGKCCPGDDLGSAYMRGVSDVLALINQENNQ